MSGGLEVSVSVYVHANVLPRVNISLELCGDRLIRICHT